ncbi:hypothetical protein HPP92_010842 [Vanilla planifolia]|uniref:Uncharacterized protein n=1 Tax=Vanilla planifolia TaxID=51239 RepID=A0A835R0T6_VANPL|nr:hypothetical protein HPP92_010842 [Vanilla planifolia]
MGNCHANDAAAAAIHHPDGRVERLYWPTSADEVMRTHPGYYVAQVTLCISKNNERPSASDDDGAAVRFTKVRLLRHRDLLLIGQVYRLVSFQEVTKAVRGRRHDRIRKAHTELVEQQKLELQHHVFQQGEGTALFDLKQEAIKHERERQRSSRCWRPSLESISEVGS